MTAYCRWVVDHPWLAMAASALLVIIAAAGAPWLGFTTSYEAYFAPGNAEWENYQAIERKFSRSDSVLIALAPAGDDVFEPGALAAVRAATEAAWRLPYAASVTSLTNFHQAYARGDELVVEPLVPEGELDAGQRAAVRERALDNPRIAGGLLAEDGEMTAVSVGFDLPDTGSEAAVREITRRVRALAERLEAEHPGLRTYLTGSVMLNRAMIDSIRSDLTHLYPVFFVLMFAVLWVFFRGIGPTLATLAVLLMSVATALGVAGWAGIVLNTASLSAAIIVLTLAIADCVHILVSFAAARARALATRAAMLESLRINARPVMLTSLTTALGFLGMNFSDSPPFRDLGNIVAVGVLAAWGWRSPSCRRR